MDWNTERWVVLAAWVAMVLVCLGVYLGLDWHARRACEEDGGVVLTTHTPGGWVCLPAE